MKINREHLEERNKKLENEIKEMKNSLSRQLNQKNEDYQKLEISMNGLEKEKSLL